MKPVYFILKNILKGLPYIAQTDLIVLLGSSDSDEELIKLYSELEYFEHIKSYVPKIMMYRDDFIISKKESEEEYSTFYNSLTYNS